MNELIREYLLFNDCGDTASVFIPGMMLACFITPAGCPDRGGCWSRNAIFFATTPEQHLPLIEWESINLSIYSAWKCQKKGFDWFLLSLMNNSQGMVERIALKIGVFALWGPEIDGACHFGWWTEAGQPEIPFDRAFLASRLGIQEDAITRQK